MASRRNAKDLIRNLHDLGNNVSKKTLHQPCTKMPTTCIKCRHQHHCPSDYGWCATDPQQRRQTNETIGYNHHRAPNNHTRQACDTHRPTCQRQKACHDNRRKFTSKHAGKQQTIPHAMRSGDRRKNRHGKPTQCEGPDLQAS